MWTNRALDPPIEGGGYAAAQTGSVLIELANAFRWSEIAVGVDLRRERQR